MEFEHSQQDSYSNYLKTANALIYKLGHEVTFINRDSIKSRPHNSAQLFSQLKTCVQKLEDILQNKVTVGNLPSSQPSYISDFVSSLNTKNPTPIHLPLIPFSPLSKKVLYYSQELDKTKAKIEKIKQQSPKKKNEDEFHHNQLRKIEEELRAIETNAVKVNNDIKLISEVNLLYWDADAIALQLTIIESDLFRKIDFKKDFHIKDKKNSRAQACLDFHRYLTNSFLHQFIISTTDNVKSSRRTSSFSSDSGGDSQHLHENIITHAIRISCYLLNVYRNFNSFAAIIKALTSPELYRIRKLWDSLPVDTIQSLKDLSCFIKKDNEYKAYKELLFQKLEIFRENDQGVVVIPWMQPHYEEIKQINHSYTTGKSGNSTEIMLSPPGVRKSMSICSLLEQCQYNITSQDYDSDDLAVNLKTTSSNLPLAKDRITMDGLNIRLPCDLSQLGLGDLKLHHWLVSRAYLNKQQLVDEITNDIKSTNNGLNTELPTKISRTTELNNSNDDDNTEVIKVCDGSFVLPKESFIKKDEKKSSLITSTINDIILSNNNNNITINNDTNKVDNSLLSYNNLSRSAEYSTILTELTVDEPIGSSRLSSSMFETTNNNPIISTSSKTTAIPIPQTSKPTSSVISPATSLNPHASAFIPHSLNSLTSPSPGPLPDNMDRINVSASFISTKGIINKNIKLNNNDFEYRSDDDGDHFVYPNNIEIDVDKGGDEYHKKPAYQSFDKKKKVGIFVYEGNNKSFDLNDDNFDLKNGKKRCYRKTQSNCKY
nr:7466_t:CDS:2 [Entrophospora candida]